MNKTTTNWNCSKYHNDKCRATATAGGRTEKSLSFLHYGNNEMGQHPVLQEQQMLWRAGIIEYRHILVVHALVCGNLLQTRKKTSSFKNLNSLKPQASINLRKQRKVPSPKRESA